MRIDSRTSLRIGIVAPPWFEIPPPAYGGIEWMCYWLVEGLVKLGHEVTLVAAGENRTSAAFHQTYSKPPSLRLGEPLPELLHAAEAARALEQLELDVIHDHAFAGPLLAAGRSIPTVVTAHRPVDGELGEYYARLGCRTSLVAISHAQRQCAPDLPWAATVHNAIPVNEYPFRDDKERFVLFLGRMSPDKGAHLAIDAARIAGYRLVLAGKCDEPMELAYFESEIRPRLGADVEWIGQADTMKKKDLLSRAHCLIFPILWEEPFGLVMVEAMACGTPVVALRAGSVPEVVVDGVTGFVRDDPSELPDAIRNAGAIDAHVCRKHVAAGFHVDAMVAGYQGVYERAVMENRQNLVEGFRLRGGLIEPQRSSHLENALGGRDVKRGPFVPLEV